VNPPDTIAYLNVESMVITIPREGYFQAGMLIPKGGYPAVQEAGIAELRARIARVAPFLAEVVGSLEGWDQVKLLTVQVNRLDQWWQPGLLCIGDAAHAMSPIAGEGINLAIQDAVAAANLLAPGLIDGSLRPGDLAAVQKRRETPARVIQRFQILLHRHLLERIFDSPELIRPPFFMRMADWFPGLQRLTACTIGMGFRPEHVGVV
jgi:2-polyprenyl-6-methoxyphenol hydroxylase-like FAD-dependent oxidoreductase